MVNVDAAIGRLTDEERDLIRRGRWEKLSQVSSKFAYWEVEPIHDYMWGPDERIIPSRVGLLVQERLRELEWDARGSAI